MVERNIDKKIRTLREILQAPPNERLDSEGNSHPCKYLNTDAIKIPYRSLVVILTELKLTVSMADNIPLYDDISETTVGNTDDYLLEVIVEKEDAKRLSTLLKEYEKKFPKRTKPLIREKALERIAIKMGELDTGDGLVKFLENYGVDKELIVYPNTKWRMIFDAMSYLSCSERKEDQEALFKIIGEATHPLMHSGNVSSAEALRSEFNNYLSYDKLGIGYDENAGTYIVAQLLDKDAEDEIIAEVHIEAQIEAQIEFEEKEKQQLEFLRQPKNKEKISLLKKVYQSLMNVVETFCENPSYPTSELNNAYKFLDHLVWEVISELKLRGNAIRNFNNYTSPFVNLFAAEKHYREQKRILSWQRIRPEMNAMYGDIEEIYQEVNGSDILAEPEQQKKINNIQFYLSELKEKNKETKKQEEPKEPPATRIEITGMPPLVFKESEEKKSLRKISLKSVQIDYDDDEPIIKIGKHNVGLPPYKNEHYFCQSVFEYKPKEPISWDIIYDKMTGYSTVSGGKKPEPIRENWQKVNDTMKRLNNRIKEVVNTDDDLFSWSEKMVIRNY